MKPRKGHNRNDVHIARLHESYHPFTTTPSRALNSGSTWTYVFLSLGTVSIVLFHLGLYFTVGVSVAVVALVILSYIHQYKSKQTGALSVVVMIIYLMPFIHIPPYLWFDYDSSPVLMWGLATRPYMLDKQIIELTAMIVATGDIVMDFSNYSGGRRPVRRNYQMDIIRNTANSRSLSYFTWQIWVLLGLALSAVATPKDTVFKSAYTESMPISVSWDFSSSWMMAYIVLSYAFIDAFLDKSKYRAKVKQRIISLTVLYVVVWHQLMRGDRDSLPWVFSLFLVTNYWLRPSVVRRNLAEKLPWRRLLVFVSVMLVIAMIVQHLRSGLVGAQLADAAELAKELNSEGILSISNVLSGTWSAVLLTPLSVAGDYLNDDLKIKFGTDYMNLLLSLPPGFIARILEYERPLSATTGPAWEMRYGLGGTHASVVPFMNFRMIGVFSIPAIWAAIVQYLERKALNEISVINVALLTSICLAAPHFIWYGEKNGINALILWFGLAVLYNLSVQSPQPEFRKGN